MNKIILFGVASLLFLLFMQGNSLVGDLNIAHAQQDWKQEYAEVCGETQNAMALSVAQLKDFVERCDTLQSRINELNGLEGNTERKVYQKRLKMCRDLYEFQLEYKNK